MRNQKKVLRIVESLDQPARDRFVATITGFRNECGCKLGGILAVSAIVICIPLALLSFTAISVFAGIKTVLWSALAIVTAGLVGKAIGVGVARIRLWLYIAKH